jgi:CrcB protein
MKEIWYVGIGGFLGSVLRYGINLFSYRSYPIQLIPYGTLFVNCLGCFLAGISVALLKKYNLNIESLNLFLITGFLGAFTTFSAFGNESIKLFLSNQHQLFLGNIILNVFLSIFSVWLGYFFIR